ncbi:protein kinase domain-containing protein, partial [Zavarzinella formosa]|uniref:protein kinase domain-containing protein n=1 Tax=Zavarzinella formosa TaxID=360055 RepID=UPI0012FC83C9
MTEQTVFTEALEIADPALREEYLARVCAGNIPLRQKIEALLASHEQSGEFLDVPALRQMAKDDNTETMNNGEPKNDGDEIDLSFLVPSARPGSLGRLQHYEIEAVLGSGGCGIVLKAFDEKLHRVVAIKVMLPGLALTSPARKRFIREARASAAIRHDNVVNIHAIDDGPIPFLVMEFIDGQTLQQRINGMGPLEIEEILRLGRQITQGLSAAHALGLIHRDIKPANIMIEASGRVKITDFGLARAADDASVTQSGAIAGTPLYMSPEQTQGQPLDARSDLFSLGSVLYVMACGRPPFRAGNTMAVMKRVAEEMPRPIREIIPEVPQWLVDVIAKLHAKEPEKRYASAAEVSKALATGEQDPNQAESVNRRDTKRRRWILPGLVLFILAASVYPAFLLVKGAADKPNTTTATTAPQSMPPTIRQQELPWVPLFNGKDLSGWKIASGSPENWKVEDEVLVGQSKGGSGSEIVTARNNFINYRLRVVCKAGSERYAQIMNRCDTYDKIEHQCGYYVLETPNESVYDRSRGSVSCQEREPDENGIVEHHYLALADLANSDGVKIDEWFTVEVELHGNRIASYVNGVQVSVFEDTKERFPQGRIGLQVFEQDHVFQFRSIEICELPPGGPPEPDPLLEKRRKAIEWAYKLGGTITL